MADGEHEISCKFDGWLQMESDEPEDYREDEEPE